MRIISEGEKNSLLLGAHPGALTERQIRRICRRGISRYSYKKRVPTRSEIDGRLMMSLSKLYNNPADRITVRNFCNKLDDELVRNIANSL